MVYLLFIYKYSFFSKKVMCVCVCVCTAPSVTAICILNFLPILFINIYIINIIYNCKWKHLPFLLDYFHLLLRKFYILSLTFSFLHFLIFFDIFLLLSFLSYNWLFHYYFLYGAQKVEKFLIIFHFLLF